MGAGSLRRLSKLNRMRMKLKTWRRHRLEQDVGADREGGSGLTGEIVAEERARGRLVHVHDVQVQPPTARARRVIIEASAQFPRESSKLIRHVAAEYIEVQSFWHHHVAHFRHEAAIVDRRERKRGVGDEVVQRSEIELALKREAAVLRAGVDRQLVVAEVLHRDARRQGAKVEWIDAVRQLDLARDGRLVVGRSTKLAARAARNTELRRDACVVFEVAESIARAELTGRRLPPKAPAVREIAAVVRLHLAQLAQVVVDGKRVE